LSKIVFSTDSETSPAACTDTSAIASQAVKNLALMKRENSPLKQLLVNKIEFLFKSN
jgi:hypothetical protein